MTILPPPPATLDIIGGLLSGFGVLGMRVRPDWRQSPFEVLRVALREIGIRGQRRRRQVRLEAGAREWVLKGYEVDADGLNKMTRMAEHYAARLRDRLERMEDPDGYRIRRIPLVEDPAVEEIIRALTA